MITKTEQTPRTCGVTIGHEGHKWLYQHTQKDGNQWRWCHGAPTNRSNGRRQA